MAEYRPTVLAVDDAAANLDILISILKAKYRVKVAVSGERALQVLAGAELPDLILLDIMMPGLNGVEVCKRLKADPRLRSIPVIFISALDHVQDKVRAFEGGGVDYITKPFQAREVEARVQTHIELHRLRLALAEYNRKLEERVRQQAEQVTAGQFATIFALTKLAESRDDDTGRHLVRVQTYCRLLANHLLDLGSKGYRLEPEMIETISRASSLHDIGKVGIPDNILLGEKGLGPEELATMKTHTLRGARTLEEVAAKYPGNTFIQVGMQIARSHHERWDGTGYPDCLRGTDIPLAARIVALADVYDALRSKRSYKQAYSHKDSVAIIAKANGQHFDPMIVRSFMALAEDFRAVSEAE